MKNILYALVIVLTISLMENRSIYAAEITGSIHITFTLDQTLSSSKNKSSYLTDTDIETGGITILFCHESVEVKSVLIDVLKYTPLDQIKTLVISEICAFRSSRDSVNFSVTANTSSLFGPDNTVIDVNVLGIRSSNTGAFSTSSNIPASGLSNAKHIDLGLGLNGLVGMKKEGIYTGTIDYTVKTY